MARPSAAASLRLSTSKVIPRISFAPTWSATPFITSSRRVLSVYQSAGDFLTPATGHHVWSVVTPPILSTPSWPGIRFRTSCTNTGSILFGFLPAYASTVQNSIDRPRKPGWTRFPERAGSTVAVADDVDGPVVVTPAWPRGEPLWDVPERVASTTTTAAATASDATSNIRSPDRISAPRP